jgi:NAD+ kinase
MKVLIVRKATNFELHGAKVEANVNEGILRKANLDKLKSAHLQHYRTLDLLRQNLDKNAVAFAEIGRGSPWPNDDDFDAIISVGGDGTLLSASHHIKNCGKIIGIRSSDASVGYLCAAGSKQIKAVVTKLVKNKVEYLEVARLQVKIEQVGSKTPTLSYPILNDILFTNTNPAATTRYKIFYGVERETHKSSGVWVSTATGSTAGIAAAGGKALKQTDQRFQFMVRELYKAKGEKAILKHKIFDPSKHKLTIENRNERALVALDGQHGETLLGFGDRIQIQRGSNLLLAKPDH